MAHGIFYWLRQVIFATVRPASVPREGFRPRPLSLISATLLSLDWTKKKLPLRTRSQLFVVCLLLLFFVLTPFLPPCRAYTLQCTQGDVGAEHSRSRSVCTHHMLSKVALTLSLPCLFKSIILINDFNPQFHLVGGVYETSDAVGCLAREMPLHNPFSLKTRTCFSS